MAKKPRSDSKLKNLLPESQEALWELLTEPQVPMDADQPGGAMRPFTLQELQAEVPLRHGFTVALSTLSEWHSWYSLKLRTERAALRVDQAKLEWLKENPETTPEELERLGQILFTSESIEAGNAKAFVALRKLSQRDRVIEHDGRRIALLEEKAAKYDALTNIGKESGLSEQEIRDKAMAHVDEMLGLTPPKKR